jgi:hypothetical protein
VGLTTDWDERVDSPECAQRVAEGVADPKDCQSKYLYVVSSDFDLQYNAGSIQALELEAIRGLVPTECETDADCQGGVCEFDSSDCPSSDNCSNYRIQGAKFCVAQKGADPCMELGHQSAAERATVPGPCGPIKDLSKGPRGTKLLFDRVGTGAFASDVLLKTALLETDPGVFRRARRLLVPVRGESSLHWIDLKDDGRLACGQENGSYCSQKHRVGTEPTENSRGYSMPPEPYAIAASDAGDAIAITHQTEGSLSLFTQNVVEPVGWNHGPQLQFIHSLDYAGAIAIAAAPEPAWVRKARDEWLRARTPEPGEEPEPVVRTLEPDPYPPGFLVAYRNAARVDLVRYAADSSSDPPRPFMQTSQHVALRANSGDTDSRGIVYDDSARRACEEPYLAMPKGAARDEGLRKCADMSVGIYLTSRSPASLLVGGTSLESWHTPAKDLPTFNSVERLSLGASRVYVGKVVVDDGTPTGALETRIFAVCFDQRRIVIYDPVRRIPETSIVTGRGPHALAFDFYPGDANTPARALAYVAHFTDSYIGVIQLDRRKIRTYASIVLSVGEPTGPRASK